MKQMELEKREGARKTASPSNMYSSASLETVHVATEAIDTSATNKPASSSSAIRTLKAGKGMSLKKY